MHATNTSQTQQVNFLTCFDQSDVAWSDEWVTTGIMPPPKETALRCVNQTGSGLDYKAVLECGNGKLGTQLQQEALEYFMKTFPMLSTGARFDVPHIYINGVEQNVVLPQSLEKPSPAGSGSAWTYLKTLCDINSEAGACAAVSTGTNGSASLTSNVGSQIIATV